MGLGTHRQFWSFTILWSKKSLESCFLQKSALNEKNLEGLRVKLGGHDALGVDRTRTGGGLALLWKKDFRINVHSYSIAHIDATIIMTGSREWHFTGFYGNPETSKCCDSWTLLWRLQCQDDMPWLVIGNFNEILDSTEKNWKIERNWKQMEAFRQVLSDCALCDMGYHGNRFT